MKHIVISIIIIFFGIQYVNAQDLIVTEKGDSLNCKITKIKGDYIYFSFMYDNETRNTLLSLSEIKFYKKDFFSTIEVRPENIENYNGSFSKFRFGGYGGYSYLTAKISDQLPPGLSQYMKDLKSGYHLGADVSYFISESIGFGLKYSMFKTNNQINIYAFDTINNQYVTGKLKDDIKIQYFGPSILIRTSNANKSLHFICGFSLGSLAYKNNATIIDDYLLTSKTIGMFLDAGIDVALGNDFYLSLFISSITGSLNKFNYDDGKTKKIIELPKNQREGISRIDASIGLRWNF